MSGVSYFRLHSYSDKFNSDSSPAPKVFLISYSDSELFKVWETNVVTSKSQFTLASFLVSILKFDTRFRFQQINKKRTPIPLRSDKNAILRLRVLPISGTNKPLSILSVSVRGRTEHVLETYVMGTLHQERCLRHENAAPGKKRFFFGETSILWEMPIFLETFRPFPCKKHFVDVPTWPIFIFLTHFYIR